MAAQALSAPETSGSGPLDAGSHATNLEEQATRMGVLWVKVGARRERRTFLLFNQVGARARARVASAPCARRWARTCPAAHRHARPASLSRQSAP